MGKYQVADLTCLILWVLFALFCGPLSFAQESFGCKVLLSAVRGPEVEQEFDLMSLTEAALKAVLNDYERTLEVYYELKNKEPNPKSFVNEFGGQKLRDTFGEEAFSSLPDEIKNSPASVCHTCEFRRSEYDLYRDYLDNDIRLSNNLFLALFNHHGGGGANDVFQRFGDYLVKLSGINIDPETYYKIHAIALYQSRLLFNKVSAEAGYPKNRFQVDEISAYQANLRFFGQNIEFF